ncbi:ATPase inhibitor subunit zeta [Rhizobium binxianense]
MSILEDREEAAEKEYVMRLEQSFRVRAKRDRMLARWAADLIGRQDLDAYFDEVTTANLAKPQDEGVFHKVWADLQSAGAAIDQEALRQKMHQLLLEADEEVRGADRQQYT